MFVEKLDPAAAEALGLKYLPRANVALAAAKDAAREGDLFVASCNAWQPRLDECIGALVWMTPTFNTYFNDLRDSLYSPSASAVHLREPRQGHARHHEQPAPDLQHHRTRPDSKKTRRWPAN